MTKVSLSLLLLALAALPVAAPAASPSTDLTRESIAERAAEFVPGDHSAAPEFKEPTWVWFSKPKAATSAEQLRLAKSLEEKGRLRAASRAYDALVHAWGSSPEAPEAQFRLARTLERRGKLEHAFREFQYYIEHYVSGTESVSYKDAIDAQFAIANTLRGKLHSGPIAPSEQTVASLFRRLALNAPSAERAPEFLFYEALVYEQGHAFGQAVSAYERVAAKYPNSPRVGDCLYRIGFCRAAAADENPHESRASDNAVESFRLALETDPDNALAAEARAEIERLEARIVDLEFENAAFYDQIRKDPAAAIRAYGDFARRHPDSERAESARTRIAELERTIEEAKAAAEAAAHATP